MSIINKIFQRQSCCNCLMWRKVMDILTLMGGSDLFLSEHRYKMLCGPWLWEHVADLTYTEPEKGNARSGGRLIWS